jgi:hypothetical protein
VASSGSRRTTSALQTGGQPGEQLGVQPDARAPQRIDPRTERQDLRALVAPADEGAAAARLQGIEQFLHQPRLADAGLADDQDDVRAALRRRFEKLPQAHLLHGAPDQRCLVDHRFGGRGHRQA